MRTGPTPFYFGPPGAGLFGWLHASRTGIRPAFGLVICNPFGFEEVCAHRSLALLAEGAALGGVPSLRFDLAGCGNSEGDEFEPGQLEAWLGSVHAAIDQLKARTGVARVCLLGMRLGASLATLAATRRDDIAGLIAIAPVVRGRDFVRELRMLAESPVAPGASSGALLESAGFALTPQTVEALRAIDLRSMTKAPAPRALIVERDDLPAPRHWHDALMQVGVQTRTEAWPGYAAIMSNPQDAQPPHRIVDGVLATLAEWQPAVNDAARPSASGATLSTRAETLHSGGPTPIRETVVGIAAGDAELFGILTAPGGHAGTRAPARTPARTPEKRIGILMLNSGSVHHIGPNRLWVTLARRWAARGITVLRIDLSGIGDSPAHVGAAENRVYSNEAARDIAAALARLRREGIAECHVLGLCSGAFHALNAAVAGEPFASALMINPLTYSWEDCARLGHALNEHEVLQLSKKYRHRAFNASTWRRLVRGELDLKLIAGVLSARVRDALREWLARGRRCIGLAPARGLAASLAAAAQRGIRLHFIFGKGASGHALMRRQAGPQLDGLLARSQVSIDLVTDSDHTFTRFEARERLIGLLDTLVLAGSDESGVRSVPAEAARTTTAPRAPRQLAVHATDCLEPPLSRLGRAKNARSC